MHAMAISGNPWPSVAIHGHQWQSMAISGNPWQSVVIDGHQWQSMGIQIMDHLHRAHAPR